MANDVDEAGLPKLSSGGIHWSPFLVRYFPNLNRVRLWLILVLTQMQEALAAESQSRSSFLFVFPLFQPLDKFES